MKETIAERLDMEKIVADTIARTLAQGAAWAAKRRETPTETLGRIVVSKPLAFDGELPR